MASSKQNATASAAERGPLGRCAFVSNQSVPSLPAGSVRTDTQALQTRAELRVSSQKAGRLTSNGLAKVPRALCPRHRARGVAIAS